MVTFKKPEEIEIIRQGGRILAEIINQLVSEARVGMITKKLDELAEKLIINKGGVPSFKNYSDRTSDPPFPTTICASVNDQLVHTPACDYVLQNGDILSIDIGMQYPAKKGYFTDMAVTTPIGKISRLASKLLKVTKTSLAVGITQVKPGNQVADIGRAVQQYVEGQGFSVVRQLVGHGVGYQVHEEPRVPNFFDPKQPKIELKEGMVLAIEPMVNVGDVAVRTLEDGWTVATADGSLCAHFEHTVVVTAKGAEVLTQLVT